MKRACLFLISLLCVFSMKAQTSVCGVVFGQSYDFAKSYLAKKYGTPEIDENNEIWYFNRDYAGIPFGFIGFKFQSDGFTTYFNECVMGREFEDVSLAKTFRDKIIAKLMKKYDDVEVYTDKNIFLGAHGGTSPVDDGECGFKVFVVRSEKKYTVFLDYGPYNYVNEEL